MRVSVEVRDRACQQTFRGFLGPPQFGANANVNKTLRDHNRKANLRKCSLPHEPGASLNK